MKRIIAIVTLIVMLFPTVCFGATPSNTTLVKNYCRSHYSKKTIKYVKEYSPLIYNRRGKKYIVVEKVVSKSRGKYGIDSKGYRITYNKKHKKNEKVVSYVIYSPSSNEMDDVVAIVDSGKIK